MTKLKAVGFDLGGVILPYSVPTQKQYIADELGVPYDAVEAAYRELIPDVECTRLSFDEFWDGMVRKTGADKDPAVTRHIWNDHYIHDNPLIPEMLSLVDSLRAKGLRVGLLSNIDPEHGDLNRGRGIYEHFDEVLLSYEIECRKPDAAAFQLLADRLDVQLDEIMFVDDLKLNVDEASKLGLVGYQFENHQALIAELHRQGIDI